MKLTQPEIELFYKLWYELIWGINEKHGIVPKFKKLAYGESVEKGPVAAIRKEMWENPEMINEFLDANKSGGLTEEELGIIADWRKYFVKDEFIIIKHLAKYSVFLLFEEPEKLYGVFGISESVKDTLQLTPPIVVETVLLPFKGKIIYDSFFFLHHLSFGKGVRDTFNNSYNRIKEASGIIENMSVPPVPKKPPEKKEKPPKPSPPAVDTKGAKVPKEMSARYMEIAELIEDFCDEKLNEEYKEICLRALAKLCRKRPSPIISGRAYTWACGIVYAIGSNNFIFDRSNPLYMTATEIADWFGLAKSTAGGKSAEITKLLKLSYYSSEFSTQQVIENNPMIWHLMINGFYVDIRDMPREAQEIAYQKGLIPYIPADRS